MFSINPLLRLQYVRYKAELFISLITLLDTKPCMFTYAGARTLKWAHLSIQIPRLTPLGEPPQRQMESVFSFGCVNGVIDHSGNCNISINQMKARLKVCCVRAEMHLDYFIPQNLLRDGYLLHSHYPLQDIGYLNVQGKNVLKKSLLFKVLLFSLGPPGAILYITQLLTIKYS